MLKGMSQASPKATGFGQDLFSCKLLEGKDQFLMFKRCEESHVILVIDHNHRQRGPQEFQDTGPRFRVEFLTADTQKKPLQQAIGQQDEDDLVDDQREGP